jgi:hypothetical protein
MSKDLNHQLQQLILFLLNARSNKPGGITVVKGRLPHQESYFTNQEIVAIEDANRTKYNTEPNSSMGSFIDGHPLQTQEQLCFRDSYRNTFVEKTIQSLSDSPFEPSRSLFETTVITHEFGHILGLTI